MSNSHQRYLKFLEEHTAHLLPDLRAVKNNFLSLSNTKESRIESIQTYILRVKGNYDKLVAFLPAKERPGWLVQLGKALEYSGFGNNSNDDNNYFESISGIVKNIEGFKWELHTIASTNEIDFVQIYQLFYAESKLPTLFEEIEAIFTKIINSKEIDSIRVLQSMDNVVATVKKNYKRDFFSVVCTKDFVVNFGRNYLIEILRRIPALESFIPALEKTFSEMDMEVVSLRESVADAIVKRAVSTNPLVTYSPNGFLLPYLTKEPKADLRG